MALPSLVNQYNKGGISTSAPHTLACTLHSLPPILHILHQFTMPSYSKGSRGLSVRSRVSGIFTATSISPSPWLRQRPNRYTIRAGRNLPDKEFRYLRTVIVTAAVYRGFISKLLPVPRISVDGCDPFHLFTYDPISRSLIRLFGQDQLHLTKICGTGMTSPFNLPAPGRCQSIYRDFRLRIDLCF